MNGQNTTISLKGVVCSIEAVGLRPNGRLYRRETTRQIEITVSPYRLVENAVVLARTSGHAVVGEHVDGSPSTFSGVIHATVGCNSNISKSIFFLLNVLHLKAVTLNKPENAFFLYELWLDGMLDHDVYTKIRHRTLVFPP